jgi:hypothetical protein
MEPDEGTGTDAPRWERADDDADADAGTDDGDGDDSTDS